MGGCFAVTCSNQHGWVLRGDLQPLFAACSWLERGWDVLGLRGNCAKRNYGAPQQYSTLFACVHNSLPLLGVRVNPPLPIIFGMPATIAGKNIKKRARERVGFWGGKGGRVAPPCCIMFAPRTHNLLRTK